MNSTRNDQTSPSRFQWLRRSLAGFTTVLLLSASFNSGAAALADREYDHAVSSFQAGRVSEAFGQFMDLANRGDVDSARIALFMHAYGATLYGKHWDALQSDTAYWASLVRNSGSSARAEPEFVPVKYRDAKKNRPAPMKVPALRTVSASAR